MFTLAQSRAPLALVAGLVASFAVACGGAPVDTSIPVDEARLLNSEIAAAYVRAQDLLETSTDTSRILGMIPPEVPAEELDAEMLRHVLEACYTQTIAYVPGVDLDILPRRAEAVAGESHRPLTDRADVGRVRACDPARMIALEAYLDVVDEEVDAFIIERVLTVDALRVNLKDVLVAQLDTLDRVSTEAGAELSRLREVAAERRALAQTADLTDAERRQNEIDYEAIVQILDDVEGILEQVTAGLGDMRQLRRQLVEEAARNIALLGVDA